MDNGTLHNVLPTESESSQCFLDMDDSSLNDALFHALPDAGAELFQKKIDRPPPCFHVFPLLPTEIRLKIWRSAFPPPRSVSLALPWYVIQKSCPPKYQHGGPGRHNIYRERMLRRRANLPPLPITLRVNRESREETLEYYCVLFPGELFCYAENPSLRFPEQPVCFDAGRDRLVFTVDRRMYYGMMAKMDLHDRWLDHVAASIPRGKGFQEVREIHFIQVDLREMLHDRYYSGGCHYRGLISTIHRFQGQEGLHFWILDGEYIADIFMYPTLYASQHPHFSLEDEDEGEGEGEGEGEDHEEGGEQYVLCPGFGNREEWLRRIFSVQKERYKVRKAPQIVLRLREYVPLSDENRGNEEVLSTTTRRFPGPGVDRAINHDDWGRTMVYACWLMYEHEWLQNQ